MRQENYGELILPKCTESLVDSLKGSEAKNLALELSVAQGIDIDTEDEFIAITFVERWYNYDRVNRCWKVCWEKCQH